MCHPPDWTTCFLPLFHHMATDHVVERLVTPVAKDLTGFIWSKNPKGPKVGVYLDRQLKRKHGVWILVLCQFDILKSRGLEVMRGNNSQLPKGWRSS